MLTLTLILTRIKKALNNNINCLGCNLREVCAALSSSISASSGAKLPNHCNSQRNVTGGKIVKVMALFILRFVMVTFINYVVHAIRGQNLNYLT